MFNKAILFTTSLILMLNSIATADSILSFGNWEVNKKGAGWADVLWSSDETIAGFQFDVSNISITSVEGILTEEYNWTLANNTFRVLGYATSLTQYIPPQIETTSLLKIHFVEANGIIAFSGAIFADENAKTIKVDASDTINTDDLCVADINNDGFVNVNDLLEVVGTWGQTNVPSDINGDGIVNVPDLLAIIDAWGPC